MDMSQYWVGQIPKRPLAINVRDSFGRELDLTAYDNFRVRLLDDNNVEVDLTGSDLQVGGARTGQFVFVWPTGRSLFQTPGDYLLQLVLSDENSKDYTTSWAIKVRDLGEVN